jgi:hypothetical protein
MWDCRSAGERAGAQLARHKSQSSVPQNEAAAARILSCLVYLKRHSKAQLLSRLGLTTSSNGRHKNPNLTEYRKAHCSAAARPARLVPRVPVCIAGRAALNNFGQFPRAAGFVGRLGGGSGQNHGLHWLFQGKSRGIEGIPLKTCAFCRRSRPETAQAKSAQQLTPQVGGQKLKIGCVGKFAKTQKNVNRLSVLNIRNAKSTALKAFKAAHTPNNTRVTRSEVCGDYAPVRCE